MCFCLYWVVGAVLLVAAVTGKPNWFLLGYSLPSALLLIYQAVFFLESEEERKRRIQNKSPEEGVGIQQERSINSRLDQDGSCNTLFA